MRHVVPSHEKWGGKRDRTIDALHAPPPHDNKIRFLPIWNSTKIINVWEGLMIADGAVLLDGIEKSLK